MVTVIVRPTTAGTLTNSSRSVRGETRPSRTTTMRRPPRLLRGSRRSTWRYPSTTPDPGRLVPLVYVIMVTNIGPDARRPNPDDGRPAATFVSFTAPPPDHDQSPPADRTTRRLRRAWHRGSAGQSRCRTRHPVPGGSTLNFRQSLPSPATGRRRTTPTSRRRPSPRARRTRRRRPRPTPCRDRDVALAVPREAPQQRHRPENNALAAVLTTQPRTARSREHQRFVHYRPAAGFGIDTFTYPPTACWRPPQPW